MRLDGARSATRKEPKGVTCATRVTRGTIDFQDGYSLELCAGNLQGNFRCRVPKRLSKQRLVAHTREALKVGFKQKLVPRVPRVAHVPRRS